MITDNYYIYDVVIRRKTGEGCGVGGGGLTSVI